MRGFGLSCDFKKLHKEVKLDQHAPCWTRMSIAILRGSYFSHAYGLNRAQEITNEKYGECVWPNIPEECFEQALKEIY